MEETAADIVKGAVDPETIYTKQNCIGGGSFGKVYKGVDKRTGEAVAIKIVEIEAASDDVRDIIEEISILAGLHSPYVTKYHGSYLKGSDLWIIMEYCGGGSCADLMDSGMIPEEYISIVMKELLMGLDYLHSDKKLHRDIKAANILLGSNGQVKLADFGVSGQLTATMTKKNTFVGTPFWMAPEVIKQSGYNYSADIWSLGITAIELAKGKPPHFEIHPMKVLFIIPKQPSPALEGDFTPAFKDFVAQCLKKDPRERPSARDLLKHPFIRKARKPVYLTELIERQQLWQSRHGSSSGQGLEDEEQPTQRQRTKEEEEDLWDFGTVKPAQRGGGGLRVMNEAGMNARNTVTRSPSPIKAMQGKAIENRITPPRAQQMVHRAAVERSPSRLSPKSQSPASPLSPGAASKFPLPPSPMKPQQRNDQQAAQNVSRKPLPTPLQMPDSRQSSQTSLLGTSLERSMGALAIGALSVPVSSSASSRPQSAISVPGWSSHTTQSPARRPTPQRIDTSVHQSQLPRPQRVPSGQPPTPITRTPSSGSQQLYSPMGSSYGSQPPTPLMPQQPLPAFQPPTRLQTPLSSMPTQIPQPSAYGPRSVSGTTLTSQGSIGSMSSASSSSTAASPLQQPLQAGHSDEMTALSGVITPALQAAINRRQHTLNILHRQSMLSTSSSSSSGFANPDLNDLRRRQLQSQESIRKLVGKVSRLFEEIERWDNWAPVGMGEDVGSFLEGLLEEVLVRIEEVES